ncbi:MULTISPECIES: serine protease [unclassified Mesorhizobium]|uniref:serine protease n=1 Tax=unclassified Mesorhizobium TaxID=325217 RepID=UPI00112EA037|nr:MULTISPECIES: serine protease [unclassified Mesorhizobium]TPK66276.1 hypothetical protein FJ551_09255 [Mesorhizobium sp. B2-5-1]TPM60654.1 hypothetical protein FJ962_16110 [Mesorhizobium sp. B2-1-9]TPN11065.1 hypothetical protein FJ971_13275 [Mesorhizobium sp. B2-1-2]UCI14728.1 trypsin-like peptidase domain-containing protein [Mesorhizobium sp. B2-1-1]
METLYHEVYAAGITPKSIDFYAWLLTLAILGAKVIISHLHKEEALRFIHELAVGNPPPANDTAIVALRLRDSRDFGLLIDLAKAARNYHSDSPILQTYHAQAAIELGDYQGALGILSTVELMPGLNSTISSEIYGLRGRALKEIFLHLPDKSSQIGHAYLSGSIAEYRKAFRLGRDWAAVNILALSRLGQHNFGQSDPAFQSEVEGRELLTKLDQAPHTTRDLWYHATRAELRIGFDDISGALDEIAAYLSDPSVTSFAVAGTLRQYTEVWNLPAVSDEGAGIVEALQARLLQMNYGQLRLNHTVDAAAGKAEALGTRHLEALLGPEGVKSIQWMRRGTEVARSVCAIRQIGGGKIGTGFVVAGGDFIPSLGAERVVLTNSHVVSGTQPGSLHPDECEVVFEEIGELSNTPIRIKELVWSSPIERLDAAIIRLVLPIVASPLLLAPRLPLADGLQKVYLIGYPRGDNLSISIDGNVLLDHEGPTIGTPPEPTIRRRLHYSAPTEKGSSGSPVFNASKWEVIGLHHAGGQIPRLNGKSGLTSANEGLWIQAVAEEAKLTSDI